MLAITSVNAEGNKYPAWEKLCIVKTPEVVKVNKLMQVKIGQGEGDTKWKGWPWKALLLKFDIIKNYFVNTIKLERRKISLSSI